MLLLIKYTLLYGIVLMLVALGQPQQPVRPRRGRAGRHRNGPRPHCQNATLPQR